MNLIPVPHCSDERVKTVSIILKEHVRTQWDHVFLLQFVVNGKAGYMVNFQITTTPTQNCQLACIGAVQSLTDYLHYCSDKATVNEKQQFTCEVFTEVRRIINEALKPQEFVKYQYIIDFHQSCEAKIKQHFPLLINTPYKSTNDSNMHLAIVRFPGEDD